MVFAFGFDVVFVVLIASQLVFIFSIMAKYIYLQIDVEYPGMKQIGRGTIKGHSVKCFRSDDMLIIRANTLTFNKPSKDHNNPLATVEHGDIYLNQLPMTLEAQATHKWFDAHAYHEKQQSLIDELMKYGARCPGANLTKIKLDRELFKTTETFPVTVKISYTIKEY